MWHHFYENERYMQRSKLTFSKSRLLATFNYKMVAIKNSIAKKNLKGGHFMTLHLAKKQNIEGRTLNDILHEGLMLQMARFQHLTLVQQVYAFMSSFWTTRGEKRKTGDAAACTIDWICHIIDNFSQVSFCFNLLVAKWRLSPEVWSPKIFSTHHGDQNGRSLERWHDFVSETLLVGHLLNKIIVIWFFKTAPFA